MKKYNTIYNRIAANVIDGIIFAPLTYLGFFSTANKYYFFGIDFIYLLLWTVYSVISHNKYGQTVGEKIMRLKVYDVNEANYLTYQKAFFRESIWVGLQFIALTTYTIRLFNGETLNEEFYNNFAFIEENISIVVAIISVITMIANSKKRSPMDFLAGSVVVKT
jgi:uncharacterized RDD family membrane protein YckC